jgi:hypothetical protein
VLPLNSNDKMEMKNLDKKSALSSAQKAGQWLGQHALSLSGGFGVLSNTVLSGKDGLQTFLRMMHHPFTFDSVTGLAWVACDSIYTFFGDKYPKASLLVGTSLAWGGSCSYLASGIQKGSHAQIGAALFSLTADSSVIFGPKLAEKIVVSDRLPQPVRRAAHAFVHTLKEQPTLIASSLQWPMITGSLVAAIQTRDPGLGIAAVTFGIYNAFFGIAQKYNAPAKSEELQPV